MNPLKKLLVLSAVALSLGLLSVPAAVAQIPEASWLPVTEPVDVGGTILQPGRYLIRVVPTSNRNFIQVTNADRSEVYATVLTVPHAIPAAEDQLNTEFVFFPTAPGTPKVLRTWFAPNPSSHAGHDIVFSEERAMELAALANEPIVAYKGTTVETAELETVSPQKTVTPYVVPAPPAPRVAVVEPAPAPTMVAEARELPQTAGSVPLFATLGALLLGAAVGIRLLRVM